MAGAMHARRERVGDGKEGLAVSALSRYRSLERATMWSAIFGSSEPEKQYADKVNITINGKSYSAGSELTADTSLNTFIRDVAHLKGTKFMCNEGGCGACVVAATAEHPVSKQRETFSVNSCLVPVFACDGWEIKTVEGLGDRRTGYHRAQATLAHFNGTQCGYCSPGMGNKAPTMADVENSFGGNLCRCTGYRPILDAFKSLSTDATPELKQACLDIEDIYKICSKTGNPCSGSCSENFEVIPQQSVRISTNSTSWFKPKNLDELFTAFTEIGDAPYKLVFGNTAEGIYRSEGIETYIDIKSIAELRTTSTAPVFTLGGNVTLTEAMRIFKESASQPGYVYMRQLAHHIDKIANVPVRNVGTLAGNLSIKQQHHEFPSDIFTTFETVGAKLNIMDSEKKIVQTTLTDYLLMDMKKKIILSIEFPKLSDNHRLRTFKITPRAQNAHAYVNAGFLINFENTKDWKVIDQPRIVYGGINPQFVHASNLETFLTGKNIFDSATISKGLAELDRQLLPDHVLPDATPEFRKKLAQALFYKFVLSIDPSKVRAPYRSGGKDLERPLSSGKQEYETDKTMWPVNQPIPKIEALAQCSGEAEFINDLPSFPNELHAAFVLTNQATGKISKIDAESALAYPGVVGFFEKFTNASGYAGQAVGMIVAETRDIALKAAKKVKVEYMSTEKPVISVEQVLRSAGGRIKSLENSIAKIRDTEGQHVIKGEFEIGKQYHLTMETQTCLIVPKEDSYDVFCACQWMDNVQAVVSRVLEVPSSQVNMQVRRLGGGYGAKTTRPGQLAGACAMAAKKLNRPIRLVDVDNKGKIKDLRATLYQDSGINFNDSPLQGTLVTFKNCYGGDEWNVEGKQVRTDTASNTWCRAPGTTEGVALIEEIMERIAATLKLDPLQVRLENMDKKDNPLPQMIEELKTKADYDKRLKAVNDFNASNRWIKRGISIVPMKYAFHVFGNFSALVSIYQIDGAVSVTHGGIEMGQGINTKVAQVAAHILGIPLEKVSIKPSNSMCAPNNMVTAGSIGSEAVAYATMMACQELLKRLEPVKKTMKDPTWLQLIKKSYSQGVELCATHMYTKKDDVKDYFIYGAAVGEVEVDLLTGEKQVLRVDLLEDVGNSLSPLVDIGQIEGAFVMGMGYWLTEELNYKPPGAKDIPIDFRVYFKKNANNPVGVLQSKATGEPPLNLSIVVYFALQHALTSARKDAEAADGYHVMKPQYAEEVKFTVNGVQYSVGSETPSEMRLNAYIRKHLNLTGTKFMCYEGGCGACVVTATIEHPVTKQRENFAVNSCLAPVLGCDGWEIKTIEGIGGKCKGYHPVQAALAHFNGTQCGYCSPGMVMNMYSLLEGNKAPTMADVENSFGGNLCRCTGYRPILDAFKSLSTDATPELKKACLDIEDSYKLCEKSGRSCNDDCENYIDCSLKPTKPIQLSQGASSWYKVRSIQQIFTVWKEIGDAKYKLVAGNTSEGVYRSQGIEAYIDIKDVAELRTTSTTPVLCLGGNVTLTEAMRIFNESASSSDYAYLRQLAQHIDMVANVPVRNVGTLAGNLSIKKEHPEFPSDIFTIFETVGALLNIMDSFGQTTSTKLTDYLMMDMNKKLILSITFPFILQNTHSLRTFKIAPRAQNAHAIVNAGFLFTFQDSTHWRVIDQPRIVYGGINPTFVHASNLETYLTGKNLLNASSVANGLAELGRQLNPDHVLPDASPEYRKHLAEAIFYKFLLNLDSKKVRPAFRSGANTLERPLSSGQQHFETDKQRWPVNQPIPKIEAVLQSTGEAEYVNDLPRLPGELQAAFVITKCCVGTIANIDATAALAVDGVVAFFKHTTIPGQNTFTPKDFFGYTEEEEIFCSDKVKYAGQAVGLIVAETVAAAMEGARKVKIEYSMVEKPMLSLTEVLRNAKGRINPVRELQTEVDEIGTMVLTSSRAAWNWENSTISTWRHKLVWWYPRKMVSKSLQLHNGHLWYKQLVDVVVRRLGGAYGGKLTKTSQVAAACAIAAQKLCRPVRCVLTLHDNMEMAGKRHAVRSEYEVKPSTIVKTVHVESSGKINKLNAKIYMDNGAYMNDSSLFLLIPTFASCYEGQNWVKEGVQVRTDSVTNTFCRAPGTCEAIAFVEEIMERIAHSLKLDPLAVRMINMASKNNPIPEMIAELKTIADYESRRKSIEDFNVANRWKKRGIAITPMTYPIVFFNNFSALVSVFQAHTRGIELSASYMYSKQNDTEINDYAVYGVTITEVEVDVLTGEKEVVRVDLLEDVGNSLSPLVDVGQIEGAFVMGMGYYLTEELIYDPDCGKLINNSTWKNSTNPVSVLQSKTTGEPALAMAVSCYWALHQAVKSARKDAGVTDYFVLKHPATVENIFLATLTNPRQFQL
ncbi:hypothetical protein B566_EDAN007356 [Ephemera danica]|nr:hypothetical protein B566_EDAN007356 [Ephemera danica]